ncbi:MAG: class I SAM-dependent methyltransferase [candidate division WOR-3 bacterium]
MPLLSRFSLFYLRRLLPRIGSLLSGVVGPYEYLRDSVQTFFDQRELAERMERIGFINVRYFNLTGGIAALHLGEKMGADDQMRDARYEQHSRVAGPVVRLGEG